MEDVVILGCGYTGRAVTARLRGRGLNVIATTRRGSADTRAFELPHSTDLSFIPPGARVLYSIPTFELGFVEALDRREPSRLVYLSTTSVYGATRDVDETTPVAPRSPAEWARVRAEEAVLAATCSSIVLRPAAIYGSGRGIHVKMLAGTFRLAGDGSNYVSRIHVEDLAAIAEAALFSDVHGAWPVADDEPCESREIAEFCAALLGVPMPESAEEYELHTTRRADRRVDGKAIRRILSVSLRFPSYRQGVPASIE